MSDKTHKSQMQKENPATLAEPQLPLGLHTGRTGRRKANQTIWNDVPTAPE
jgi:hypothetical protein